jgi:hypothetical protein
MRVWKLICPEKMACCGKFFLNSDIMRFRWFEFCLLFLLFGCFIGSIGAEALAEVVYREGKVELKGAQQDAHRSNRNLYYDSIVETSQDGFAVFSFYSGLFLKAGPNTVFRVNSFDSIGVLSFHLLKGELFFHVPHIPPKGQKPVAYEVQTPFGFVSSALGDFYISADINDEILQILSTEDRQLFEFANLEYSLNAGDKIVVARGRVFPKDIFSGAENRMLFSWYRRGTSAPLPEYFKSLQAYDRGREITLSDFTLNGLSDGDWQRFRIIGAQDLVLGRIRLEGRLINSLPHQILQISTDGGKTFFDLDYDEGDGFLLKLLPEERDYKIHFRMRDFERFYPVTQPEIEFIYQSAGLRDLLLEWKEELEGLFNQKRADIITAKFADCGRFGHGLGEILREEFNQRSFQKLELFIVRVYESRDTVSAALRWNLVYTRDGNIDPVRTSGFWRLVFRTEGMTRFSPVESAGQPPFGTNSGVGRVDRKGPAIFGPVIHALSGVGPSLISDIRIEDELSDVVKVEYFFDRIGRTGSGRTLPAKDGAYDSRLEYVDLLIPVSFRSDRVFLRALDARGNWSEPQSIVIHRP